MRTHYAHPIDVLRKFKPTLDVGFLRDERYFGASDLEKIVARIEEVEGEFDSETRNPQRMSRRGRAGDPATWEMQEADLWRNQGGVKVWLDNMYVVPLDSPEGDALEIRVGRDDWRDITDDDRWELHPREGWVRIFSRYRRHIWRNVTRDRILRTTYRHGAPGGDRQTPGQTALSSNASAGDGQLEVDEPGRLPRGGPCLVGGEEYVRIERNDGSNPVEVTRGARGTEESEHDAGATVHYCTADVRSAVAAKTACELVRYDDVPEELPAPEGGVSHREKIEDWSEEFEKTKRRYAKVRNV